jgi:4a-hydroxytetrahydrobiopterin dehydratase
MTDLTQKKCEACEGGVDPLKKEEIKNLLQQINEWEDTDKEIFKNFEFQNFQEALDFVNKVGEIAENEEHHPDILLHSYKKVKIALSTHAIDGLSENDFIVAAKIDKT